MSLPLSYPGLKCVLENLEAVKRAHIVVRSPGLQIVDKLISLRLKDFLIHRNELNINNLMIICDKNEMETKKATGTTFVISTDDKDFISEKLREFEQAFGEYRSNLYGVNERFIFGLSKFSIPINIDSKIQVYAIEDPEEDFPYKIIVKPVSAVLAL
ncbi:hypothetical protein GCK72_007898 [Caenorhabditis remanei]|uniref:Uncharacterized protein n=1 Tax=Caenorhabditis remanei TaxID=31234 RepID=A0A6A5HJ94_CAERE|nr:hypothetical protein GCK72_007898 [Caenorhabditis remanei]KAF1767938.1 hypothetical protein GCK72_007898 [Caenorhabditis remanei]